MTGRQETGRQTGRQVRYWTDKTWSQGQILDRQDREPGQILDRQGRETGRILDRQDRETGQILDRQNIHEVGLGKHADGRMACQAVRQERCKECTSYLFV
jgi:hypothetical protein